MARGSVLFGVGLLRGCVPLLVVATGCANRNAPADVAQATSALLGSASLRLEVLTNSCSQNQPQDFAPGASQGFDDGGHLDSVISDLHAHAIWFATATNNE
jgi:hypothetical protein